MTASSFPVPAPFRTGKYYWNFSYRRFLVSIPENGIEIYKYIIGNQRVLTCIYKLKCSAMVLKAWTGKKDKAATMKITAKVTVLNVTESVFNVPDVSGIYFLPARSPAMATCPIKRDCEAESGCIFRRRYFCAFISDRGSIFGKLQRFHTRGRLCDRDHHISGNR